MIIHQYLREYVDIEPLRYLPDSFHEITAILIIDKNIDTLISAR